MHAEEIRSYALSKDFVSESFPFGEDTLVFKYSKKIFLLMNLDAAPLKFNVKCDPDVAVELREQFPENIFPGYHMNKKHWNTIMPAGMQKILIQKFIDDSYNLVAKNNK